MQTSPNPQGLELLERPYRRLVQAACVLAVVAGLWFGYDIGHQMGGKVMGFVMAVNAALFCSIMVDVIAERIFRRPQAPDSGLYTKADKGP